MTKEDTSEGAVIFEEPAKKTENYFSELAAVDVSNMIDKKNGYSYLSWAYAQDQLKRKHPTAQIITKRFPDPELGGVLVPYMRTSLGYFVEVEVIIDGVSVSEPFPVLDYRNKPIAKPTTFDINNSIQRAKVKSIAGHGLGLYIYAGEDLPIDDSKIENQSQQGYQQQYQQVPQQQPVQHQPMIISPQQQQQLKDIAVQIANLTLGTGATQEAVVEQMKQIYDRHKLTANMAQELADVKIAEMNQELKAILDSRMNPQHQQVPQQNQPIPLFSEPGAALQSVI